MDSMYHKRQCPKKPYELKKHRNIIAAEHKFSRVSAARCGPEHALITVEIASMSLYDLTSVLTVSLALHFADFLCKHILKHPGNAV